MFQSEKNSNKDKRETFPEKHLLLFDCKLALDPGSIFFTVILIKVAGIVSGSHAFSL